MLLHLGPLARRTIADNLRAHAFLRRQIASIALAWLSLAVVACHGGGGSPAPLVFATAGPIQKTYGAAAFTNSASGGSGAITYTSSDTSIATVVGNSGTVTIMGVGDVTITASDPALQHASYELMVSKASQSITLSNSGTLDVIVGISVPAPVASSSGPAALAFSSSMGKKDIQEGKAQI